MNILFVINFAGNGGSERYVDNLQRIFTLKGHSCHLAYNVAGGLSETMAKRNIPCIRLGLCGSDAGASSKLLAQYCRENEIDVIHAQFPAENIIALKSLKYYSKPKVVFTSHLYIDQGLKWKVLNKIYSPKNHAVICVHDDGVKNLKDNGIDPSKIRLVYNGVEPSDAKRKPDEKGRFRMITLTRYSSEKGLDFLLEVLALVKERTDKAFICRIVGDGEGFDDFKNKAFEMGLGENIEQTGYRSDSFDLLLDSDLYLNTSRSEAMSFAILEAMNAALPIAASNVGGNPKLVCDKIVCGKLARFGDAKAFADNIISYMNDSELSAFHGSEARRKIKEYFDLNKLADEVLSAYE